MQWWEWAAWVVAIGGAIIGSLLGIRSELRARYQPTWAFDVATTTTVINRTGEDATDVKLSVGNEAIVFGTQQVNLVPPDGEASFLIRHRDREHLGDFDPTPITVSWTRRTTGQRFSHANGNVRGRKTGDA